MRRADRLLELLQLLRRLTPPATAAALADALEISKRTVYRDIEALRRLGVGIEGEAGFGYLLTEDNALPPLMFTGAEVDALALGLRKVIAIGDSELAAAARNAIAKLGPMLPDRVKSELQSGILYAHSYTREARLAAAKDDLPPVTVDPALIRQAARREEKLWIRYQDQAARRTARTVWPLAIAYLDTSDLMITWCELRQDYRTFRLDRLLEAAPAGASFRPQRIPLLRGYFERLKAEEATRKASCLVIPASA
jgi:predicted DNA-binding transcriptional regulator YafY